MIKYFVIFCASLPVFAYAVDGCYLTGMVTSITRSAGGNMDTLHLKLTKLKDWSCNRKDCGDLLSGADTADVKVAKSKSKAIKQGDALDVYETLTPLTSGGKNDRFQMEFTLDNPPKCNVKVRKKE